MSNNAAVADPQQKATVQTAVETIVLPIHGMTCAACQAHVERSLRAAPGVVDATVNLLAHSARVMYAPAESSPTELVAVVDEAGYEANLPAQGASTDHLPQNEAVDGTRKERRRSRFISAMAARRLASACCCEMGL